MGTNGDTPDTTSSTRAAPDASRAEPSVNAAAIHTPAVISRAPAIWSTGDRTANPEATTGDATTVHARPAVGVRRAPRRHVTAMSVAANPA